MLQLTKIQQKLFAGLWFSGCGFMAALIIFLVPAVKGGFPTVFSSLVLPTLSAGVTGYLYGATILDPQQTRTYRSAFLRGVLITFLTFIVFALLLVVFNALTQGGALYQFPYLLAALVFVMIAAIVTAGPISFCVSTIGAIILFHLFRQATK